MGAKDSNYRGILIEVIRDEIRTVHVLVSDQPTHREFNELRQDVEELKQDMKTVKAAVTATNNDVTDLNTRVTRLEAASGLP